MKGNLLQKLIAVVLVFCMCGANLIFVATNTVYAIAESTELEGGNIVFEAYFKNNDNKLTAKTANISEGDNLYLGLEIKAGKLQDAKIKIDNANFKIDEGQVNNKYVNSINTQTNEIVLNEISYNDGAIEISLPIKFEEAAKIATSYFEMENSITLSGKYINSSENGKDVQTSPIKTKLTWIESETGLEFSGNIEKQIYLENSVLVQVNITSTYKDKYFPKENETITIAKPKANGITPSYAILVDGEKLDSSKITDSITDGTISFTKNFIDGENIEWQRQGNTYKVIFVYEGTNSLTEALSLPTTIQAKLYKGSNTLNGNLSKIQTGYGEGSQEGTVASVEAKSQTSDIYKGYMYANSNETTYKESYNMEISNVNGITATLELSEDSFVTESGNTITTNNQTEYKELVINKDNLAKILGEKGSLKIVPQNNNVNQITVDSKTNADESGNIVISYDKIKDAQKLSLQIVSAENEGQLKIQATKAIKGNAGYDKETIKTINAVETTIKAYTNGANEAVAKATTQLKETVTEATLTMSNNNVLSTTSQNDVEFLATLKTGTMDTDLLKAPTIKIILPTEVAKTELTSVSALYAEEEIKIASAEVLEDGKVISIKFDGEQINYNNKFLDGIKVTINTKITLREGVASRENATIQMIYTNENSSETQYATYTPVSIQAPYGLNTTSAIQADIDNTGKGTQTVAVSILNNYEKEIENLSLIGKMPSLDITQEEFEKTIKDSYKAQFTTQDSDQMAGAIIGATGEQLTIQYSQDKENWSSSKENANYYKLLITNENPIEKLSVGEKVIASFKIDVDKLMSEYEVSYTIDGKDETQVLKINKTILNNDEQETSQNSVEENNSETSSTSKQLDVKVTAKTGNTTIKQNQELMEGQVVKYIYTIKNNYDHDINNAKLSVKHEGANIFEEKTEQQVNTSNTNEMLNFTLEVETDKSEKEFDIGTIKQGDTKTITYQIRIQEDASKTSTQVELSADGIETLKAESSNTVVPGKIKIELTNNVAKENTLSKGNIFANTIKIKNISDESLKDIKVSFVIPKNLEFYELYEAQASNNYKLIQKDSNYVVFSINELAAGATKDMLLSLNVADAKITDGVKQLQATATVDDETYYSNETTATIGDKKISQIEAKLSSNIEDMVKTGDNLIYTLNIKNTSDVTDLITITDFVPEAAVIEKAYYVVDGKQTQIENIQDNAITEQIVANPQQEISLNIETKIDEEKTGKEQITNEVSILGTHMDGEVTQEVSHKLQANQKVEEEQTPENTDPEVPTIPGTISVNGSISGIVWVDENKNGIRDSTEKTLANIKVSLANVETKEYVKDEQGNKIEISTNENGEYKFENIESGKYMVVFKFDNTKYRNTEYRVNGAPENVNSDIITSKILSNDEDVKYGLTDTLELNENSLTNIDAGFIENEIFDLSLNKYISKVTVQNTTGTVTKQYNNEHLAKLEIDAKTLAGSTVIVEYTMEIKNEGEVAGYANEIVDYMPKDLTFNSQMNKDWYLSTDGNLHTTALSKELIEPGETKTIVLTLVKAMTEGNTGLTSNEAEIVKSSNDLSIPDIDSKETSKGQNNRSTAEMIISIRTGIGFTIGIIIAIIAVTATGIIIFTKMRKGGSYHE